MFTYTSHRLVGSVVKNPPAIQETQEICGLVLISLDSWVEWFVAQSRERWNYSSSPQPFWHQWLFHGRQFFHGLGWGRGNGLGMTHVHNIYCVLYFYSTFLIAHWVKNPPAMQETLVLFLGWEDPWKRDRLPTPVFWPGDSMDCIVHGVAKNRTKLSDFHFQFTFNNVKFWGSITQELL